MTLAPPPFDPELAAALEVVAERLPSSFTLDGIAEMRQGLAFLDRPDEALGRDGLFEVEDRAVPGPQGAPGI